jgi:hypothetical protein
MRKLTVLISLVLLIFLLLTGCNLPRPNAATPTDSGVWAGTAAAQTVQALSTLLAPSATVQPVSTTPPAQIASPTLAPPTVTATSALPCDRADFVDDVTIPDGTKLAPGESFVKTWRLRNSGSCTWTTSYRVVFESGNALGAPASFNLPAEVPPGATTDISIQMKAPDAPKDYESNWKLQNASGTIFGTGSTGTKPFWARITVISPTATMFAVTRVTISADNASYSGSCPHTFNLSAEITSTREGTVTYYWERSDGTKTPVQSVEFSGPGKKTVTSTFQVSSSFDGWVSIYIDNPNHQMFPQFSLKASCTP